MSHSARFSAGKCHVLGKEVNLHARMGAIGQHIALVAPVQRPIIRCDRHRRDHPRIDVVRKHAIEHEMVKRRFHLTGGFNRRNDEFFYRLTARSRSVLVVATTWSMLPLAAIG